MIEHATLIFDYKDAVRRYNNFANSVEGDVYYSVKAFSGPKFLSAMNFAGAKFEIASMNEYYLLDGISSDRVIFGALAKSTEALEVAGLAGITSFSIDSIEEMRRIHEILPDAEMYIRASVNNDGAAWPLKTKFGADISTVYDILSTARLFKINISGLSFHVGSQQLTMKRWKDAIIQLSQFYKKHAKLNHLNIGGGFPVYYPTLESYYLTEDALNNIHRWVKEYLPPDIKLKWEPGRYIVAPAGEIRTRIQLITRRHGQTWVYVDVGKYSGLWEEPKIPYQFISAQSSSFYKEEGNPVVIAGPTCDAIDVFEGEHFLPSDIKVGDELRIPSAGAYTHSTACEFNGFKLHLSEV